MNILMKLLWRNTRDTCKKLRRRKVLTTFAIALLLVWKFFHHQSSRQTYSNSTCEPIDVVYTWVNGSDPEFIASLRRFDANFDPSRFDDKQELRFSLRSLELYAPWVRHVYIVTNGQIPHWLDLSYERVSVVPHAMLAPDAEMLPTFSSSAIETFIHRIPNLSKRFLYLNDDIFLGERLYPEDLYTEAEGVRVYNAWTVPDCATDCPWVYIGDGACDSHCNIVECQFDGGDCELDAQSREMHTSHEQVQQKTKLDYTLPLKSHNDSKLLRSLINVNRSSSASLDKIHARTSFRDVLRRGNLTTIQELQRIVSTYNKLIKRSNAHAASFFASTTAKPMLAHKPKLNKTAMPYKSSKDIYSKSLIHTNMLLNRYYGFRARNVLAHVGFLMDRDIIADMEQKFHEEFSATARHRLRSADDLQFAFMYYSFVTSETYNASVEDVFDEFDTDGSLTWSDREVRTFLARMYPLPLDWSAVRYFEEVLWNCSRNMGYDQAAAESVVYSTLVYERYEDSNVPTVTRSLVAGCELLAEALVTNFATKHKYKFNINNSVAKRGLYSNFMMLTSNVSDVVDALDRIRRKPKKFNCINDNLEPQFEEDNELIRHLLEDFYLSFFPRRSKFELHEHYRNRFTNWDEYESWRWRKAMAIFIGYSASACLAIFLLRFLCLHKAKLLRRYVRKL